MVESNIEMAEKTNIRTRIAPSPTGFAHVGTAYTAIFNYAFARHVEGSFILRLEDTDVKRYVEGAENAIYFGLSWLGIDWDEGPDKGGPFAPYKQSEQLDFYQKEARKLVKEGKAYEDEGAIRFKNPKENISWIDLIRGPITFPGEEVTDFVILKSDGYPTYNFAVVIDDVRMQITHVIRGEEHISNTPKQIAMYKALGAEIPLFAHHPTLRNVERKKLSKRRDPVDLRKYKKEGYLPEALVNFLCLLGWSHPEEKEIFSLEEFIKEFDLTRVRAAGPIFDTQKLDWMNGIYIRKIDDEELADIIKPYIAHDIDEDLLRKVTPLIKERISKLSEVEPLISFFWEDPQFTREMFDRKEAVLHITSALDALSKVGSWNLEEINSVLQKVVDEKNFKKGDFYMSLRVAVTGQRITPPVNESMEILGQDKVVRRIGEARKVLIDIELPEIH